MAEGRLKSMFRSLKHRNFRLFFSGQLISLVGTWMQSVAQSWLIYRLTHSAFLLGLTGFIGQIPGFLLAAFGGVVADRHNRHKIIIITQSCAMLLAFILAALTLSGAVRVWEILALAACLGVVNGFDIPARQAFVVEMVGRADLANAIALNSSMVNGARIAGPAIAGVLVALVGEGWCFFCNGISYIAVLIGLFMMKMPAREPVLHSSTALEHVVEGFKYVRNTGPIRVLLMLLAVISLMGVPFSVLMPIFADHVLKGGAKALGFLMGMSGFGALLGALTLSLKTELKGLGRWVFYSCAGFGLGLIAFSQSRILWLSAVLLVPVGYGMMLQTAATNTLIQSMVPDRLRGRVMSFYSMMFLGMAPFGALLGGILAKPLGAPLTVALGGGACLIASFIYWRSLPHFREEARKLLAANQLAVVSDPQ